MCVPVSLIMSEEGSICDLDGRIITLICVLTNVGFFCFSEVDLCLEIRYISNFFTLNLWHIFIYVYYNAYIYICIL